MSWKDWNKKDKAIWIFCWCGVGFIIGRCLAGEFGIGEAIILSFLGGYGFGVWWLYPLWRQAKLNENPVNR